MNLEHYRNYLEAKINTLQELLDAPCNPIEINKYAIQINLLETLLFESSIFEEE